MNEYQQDRRFRRMGLITIGAVLLLIWIGAVVRASGAGMGCPDWPTCFGQWIPPVHESQLPADYKTRYADHGYADHDFDPVKTWMEYLNRLTGTSIGLLTLFTLSLAWSYRRRNKPVFYLALFAFLVVSFNGWLGAVVIDSNLHPTLVTTHMLLALLLVASLIVAITRLPRPHLMFDPALAMRLKPILTSAMILTLIQVALGTQVREQVDVIAATAADFYAREGWVERIGLPLMIHATFALAVLTINAYVAIRMLRQPKIDPAIQRIVWVMLGILGITVAVGAAMARLDIPAWLQPIHLLLAALLFSVQVFLFTTVYPVGRMASTIAASQQRAEIVREN